MNNYKKHLGLWILLKHNKYYIEKIQEVVKRVVYKWFY
jgi:hypothetical protein